MTTWVHPTGGSPKTVTLICLGPSQHDYVSAAMEHIPNDLITGSDETWTLNRGVWIHRHDLLFVMDHIGGEAESSPEYGLKLWGHDKPIITSDNANDWPEHVHLYPFGEIQIWMNSTVSPAHSDWWHNSVPYVIAYAGFIGVKELRVWGADYQHHRSGGVEDGHPNAAYWAGVMERVGLVVKPVGSSTFLGADQRRYIYGYRDDPRREAVDRRAQFARLRSGKCRSRDG